MGKLRAGLGVAVVLIAWPDLAAGAEPYRGHAIVRVELRSAADADLLYAIGDPLTDHPGPGAVDVRLDLAGLSVLDASGLAYSTLVDDVQDLVDRERARIAVRTQQELPSWYDEFRPFDQVLARLDELVAQYPEVATRIVLGTSLEGREIVGLRIAADDEPKPGLLVTGTQHAREWVATMVTTCLAEGLLTGEDPRLANLASELELFVVPVVNPDGLVFAWESERFWRKNRREGFGVDLNRNWGWHWGGDGSSANVEDENYRGTAAFSEPETTAVRDFVLANGQITTALDLHTYGQYVLWPWSYGTEAPDQGLLADLGAELEQAARSPHDNPYTPLQGAAWYSAAGAIHDWMFGARGITAYTMELRPSSEDAGGFAPGPEVIGPSCDEAIALLDRLGRYALGEQPDPDAATDEGGSETGGDGGSSEDGESGTTTSDGAEATGSVDPSPTDEGGEVGGPGDGGGESNTGGTTTGVDPSSSSTTVVGTSTGEEGTTGGPITAGEDELVPRTTCACRSTAPGPWLVAPLALILRRRRARGSRTSR